MLKKQVGGRSVGHAFKQGAEVVTLDKQDLCERHTGNPHGTHGVRLFYLFISVHCCPTLGLTTDSLYRIDQVSCIELIRPLIISVDQTRDVLYSDQTTDFLYTVDQITDIFCRLDQTTENIMAHDSGQCSSE